MSAAPEGLPAATAALPVPTSHLRQLLAPAAEAACPTPPSAPVFTTLSRLPQGVTREGAHEDVGITFWNSRYALRTVKDAHGAPVTTAADAGQKGPPQPVPEVPLFLSGSRVTILTTGKYLNAIRECGRDVERPLPPETHLGECSVSNWQRCPARPIWVMPSAPCWDGSNR